MRFGGSHPSAGGGHNSGTETDETGNGQVGSYTLSQWTLALLCWLG